MCNPTITILLCLSTLVLCHADFILHAALTSYAPIDPNTASMDISLTVEVYNDAGSLRRKIASTCDSKMVDLFDAFESLENGVEHGMMVFAVCVLEKEGGSFVDPNRALIVKELELEDRVAVKSRSRR